nr:hypothetical protein [Bacillus sp. 03113]
MNDKQNFLDAVTKQIRSKEAIKLVAEELEHHLRETKRTSLKRGFPNKKLNKKQ